MEGLRFECQSGCTACCEQPGFVYLTEEDCARIAAFLGMPRDEFEARYIYRTPQLRRLRIPREVQCVFLKPDGCSIHPVKPVQCRVFPLWPEVVKDYQSWGEAGKQCPGIGKGELIQIEAIEAGVAEMKAAYPSMYR